MPKTDNPAELPVAARPPRPASRVRPEASATGRGGGGGSAVAGSHSEFRRASSAEGPEAIDSPLPERLLEELASPSDPIFGRPRPLGLIGEVPLASLEAPSMASFDLTPSPVPRVSLAPATPGDDISVVPGPNVDPRNLPTLAACHVLGPERARAAAPAVTFPPHRELGGEGGLVQTPQQDVRSSRREIALGLTIGVALAVLLGGVGQSYLDKRRHWQAESPPSLETATLSALAQPHAASAPAQPAVDGVESLPSPLARVDVARPSAQAEPVRSKASPASARRASSELEAKRAGSASASASASARQSANSAAASARARPIRVPPGEVDGSSAPPSGEAPEKAPLSPSESAGLGLDLPL